MLNRIRLKPDKNMLNRIRLKADKNMQNRTRLNPEKNTQNRTRLKLEKNPFLSAKEKLENSEKARKRLRWAFAMVLAFTFGALTAVMMFQSVTMQESSMEPTISVGDRFFMNRISYRVSDPKRGDVIAFKTNASDEAAIHIRRIIALPGETVQIINGRVLIDGVTLQEVADFPAMTNPGLAATPVTLESGEYFVLGDNRNNSEDSRYGDIGVVQKKYIIGKLWFAVSPMRRFGFWNS